MAKKSSKPAPDNLKVFEKQFPVGMSAAAHEKLRAMSKRLGLSQNVVLTLLLENVNEDILDDAAFETRLAIIDRIQTPKSAMERIAAIADPKQRKIALERFAQRYES